MIYCTPSPYVGETIKATKPVPDVLAESIVERSLVYFNMPKRLIFSKAKSRHICDPRQMIMVALTESTRLSKARIGKMFGRDHTTVLHAQKVVRELCETDPLYRLNYNEYVKYLNRA